MVYPLVSKHLPKPRFHYSPVLRIGPWVRFSGMIALDSVTGALAGGGPGGETAKIMANLISALPDFGLNLSELVTARIYTSQFDKFADVNKAWEDALGAMPTPPCRTSVGVISLPLGASVEIEFEFYQEDRS